MQGLWYRTEAAAVSQHISGNCFSKDHQGFLLGCEFTNSECLGVCGLALLGRIHHLEYKFVQHPYFESLVGCKSASLNIFFPWWNEGDRMQ